MKDEENRSAFLRPHSVPFQAAVECSAAEPEGFGHAGDVAFEVAHALYDPLPLDLVEGHAARLGERRLGRGGLEIADGDDVIDVELASAADEDRTLEQL